MIADDSVIILSIATMVPMDFSWVHKELLSRLDHSFSPPWARGLGNSAVGKTCGKGFPKQIQLSQSLWIAFLSLRMLGHLNFVLQRASIFILNVYLVPGWCSFWLFYFIAIVAILPADTGAILLPGMSGSSGGGSSTMPMWEAAPENYLCSPLAKTEKHRNAEKWRGGVENQKKEFTFSLL